MSTPLFACSRCFSRHPFEDLSAGQQLCKECRGAFPVVKCTYCRSEFQQVSKASTSPICKKCEQNVKAYGHPTACEYCNIIAAFIGNKCQRCTNSEIKYGPPVNCEQCKQKCAFDRQNDDKKVDGKLLCWLCTLSYKRALAKTRQNDSEHRAHLRSFQVHKSRHKDGKLRSCHKRGHHRIDLAKMAAAAAGGGTGGGGGGGGDTDQMPPNKLARIGTNNSNSNCGAGSTGPPVIIRGDIDPNSSDHMVAMTQLKEQIASLQKQISQKETQLLNKDKMITELKAKHFTTETEMRAKMKTTEKEYENKVDKLNKRINQLLKEIAGLTKNAKKNKSSINSLTATIENSNSGSGTESPSIQ